MELDIKNAERKKIKQIAHHLKPEFNIGKDGTSDAFMDSLLEGFKTKEIIKVKVLDNCMQDVNEITSKLSESKFGLTLIQKIGHVFTLYRPLEETK